MHPVSFLEIGAANANEEVAFFSELFSWRWNAMGEDGEGWFKTGGADIGVHGSDPEPAIIPYFQVNDIGAVAQRVIELGGTADLPGADEPSFGRFVNCKSKQGVRFGLHQTASD